MDDGGAPSPTACSTTCAWTSACWRFRSSRSSPARRRAAAEDWPSDIHFSINDVPLGYWTSPGFRLKRGIYTPQWWYTGLNQYGLLKPLTVNAQGAFIDGQRIGEATLDRLNIQPGPAAGLTG